MRKEVKRVVSGLLAGILSVVGTACAPELGDRCGRNSDCSVQGDRVCDLSSPAGYCTIVDCVAGSCQGEGHCIRFEPDELRLASAWCMAKCGRGCRAGYRCVSVDDLNAERCGLDRKALSAMGEGVFESALEECLLDLSRVAEVLDERPGARFCVQGDEKASPDQALESSPES